MPALPDERSRQLHQKLQLLIPAIFRQQRYGCFAAYKPPIVIEPIA
jgi:hypothetical protein